LGSKIKSGLRRIIFIGKKTVGKSSLIKSFLGIENGLDKENYSAASDDFEKEMELPPYGSVLLVDSTNLDYNNEQSKRDFDKTLGDLSSNDFVIVVLDARHNLVQDEKNVFHYLKSKSIPYLAAVNKIEHGINSELINVLRAMHSVHFEISCKENVGIDALKTYITRILATVRH
jgi:small GTP-binding protein